MNIRNTKLSRNLIALVLLNTITATTYATAPGFYLGAQAGATNINNTPQTVQTGLTTPDSQLVSPSNTGIGERLYIGAGINPYAAAEFGFTHYASSTYKPSPSNLAGTPSIRENGVDLTAKIIYPIQKAAVFGKLGIIDISKSVSGSLQPLSPDANPIKATNSFHPLIGIGASYDLTSSWVADLSWTRALKGGNGFQNADFLAFGISYHFVDHYCGQF